MVILTFWFDWELEVGYGPSSAHYAKFLIQYCDLDERSDDCLLYGDNLTGKYTIDR